VKKFLILCSILLLFFLALCAAAWIALPSVGTYAGSKLLGKAIGGSVQIGQLQPGYDRGMVILDIRDVSMKGRVEGTIKNAQLQINPWKPFYIKSITISDFYVLIRDSGGMVNLIPVPVESAGVKRGTLIYRGQRYIVREAKIRNFNTGGSLEFELDGGVEGLGNIKTRGGAFLDRKQ